MSPRIHYDVVLTLVKINLKLFEDIFFVIDYLVFSKAFDFAVVLLVCAGTARFYRGCAKWNVMYLGLYRRWKWYSVKTGCGVHPAFYKLLPGPVILG
jgi:hypothetical protein